MSYTVVSFVNQVSAFSVQSIIPTCLCFVHHFVTTISSDFTLNIDQNNCSFNYFCLNFIHVSLIQFDSVHLLNVFGSGIVSLELLNLEHIEKFNNNMMETPHIFSNCFAELLNYSIVLYS